MANRHPTTITMTEARASFAKVLTRAEQGEAVEVTRGGKPVAIILSVEQYRKAQQAGGTTSKAFRTFMKTLDRRVLRGVDPWATARDKSSGRDFHW